MKDMINFLFQKYKNKGILVDTNILLLWIVGHVNRNRISKFNRTEQFLPEDYDLLVKLLNYFGQIITTPNILTEVNSLVNQLQSLILALAVPPVSPAPRHLCPLTPLTGNYPKDSPSKSDKT